MWFNGGVLPEEPYGRLRPKRQMLCGCYCIANPSLPGQVCWFIGLVFYCGGSRCVGFAIKVIFNPATTSTCCFRCLIHKQLFKTAFLPVGKVTRDYRYLQTWCLFILSYSATLSLAFVAGVFCELKLYVCFTFWRVLHLQIPTLRNWGRPVLRRRTNIMMPKVKVIL